MPKPPPDLEHAPAKWKQAFRALKDYAVATGISKVVVTAHRSDGSAVPVNVDLEQSEDGVVIKLTVPP